MWLSFIASANFLLGRLIEALSKHRAADGITLLGKLQGSDALLLTCEPTSQSAFTWRKASEAISLTLGLGCCVNLDYLQGTINGETA